MNVEQTASDKGNGEARNYLKDNCLLAIRFDIKVIFFCNEKGDKLEETKQFFLQAGHFGERKNLTDTVVKKI